MPENLRFRQLSSVLGFTGSDKRYLSSVIPCYHCPAQCHVGGREFKSRTSRHEITGHRPILGGDFSFSGCPLTPCIENELRQLGAKPAKIDPAREKGIPIIGVADLLEMLER